MKLPASPYGPRTLTRRNLFIAGGALSMIAAAGCTPNFGESTENTEGTLRFAWWGATSRQNAYTNFVQKFQNENPQIDLRLEPADYDAYVDRLSVQAAGRNLPDIFWVAGSQFLTYASQGVMLDLDKVSGGVIDYGDFESDEVDRWRVLDGNQYSVVYNQIHPVVQVKQDELSALGIELPDDETWDWDDLGAIAREYSNSNADGRYGIAYRAATQQHIEQWIRQQGAELFDGDGNIGFDATVLGDWFAMWDSWVDDGAVLPVEAAGSVGVAYPEIADRVAIELGQTNHLFDNQAVTDGELGLRLLPAIRDAAEGFPYLWYNRICVASNTADPDVAGAFIDFFINDESSLDTVGVISGPPSNPRLRELAQEKAAEDGDVDAVKVLEITERESAREMRPRYEAPAGASGWTSLLERTAENIAVGGVPITEAVETLMTELQRSIDAAQ